ASSVFRLIVRDSSFQHPRRVRPQVEQIVTNKRCRGTDDVSSEADGWSLLAGQEMSADNVLDIHAPVEKFIGLDVAVVVRPSNLFTIIFLWKEAGSSQNEAREPMTTVEQLAKILRRGLRHAVNIFRNGSN